MPSAIFLNLPVKNYAFLFGANVASFLQWTWDYQHKSSIQAPIVLKRELIVSELLLEYAIALFLALLAANLIPAPKRARLADAAPDSRSAVRTRSALTTNSSSETSVG